MNINEFNVKLLVYADGLLLLASDLKTLQNMDNAFYKYFEQFNLIFNLNK